MRKQSKIIFYAGIVLGVAAVLTGVAQTLQFFSSQTTFAYGGGTVGGREDPEGFYSEL